MGQCTTSGSCEGAVLMARVKVRRVKIHRSYTIQQLADLLEVTMGTVRRWCKRGLPCLNDKRPFLIEGQDFHEFHAKTLARKKNPSAGV